MTEASPENRLHCKYPPSRGTCRAEVHGTPQRAAVNWALIPQCYYARHDQALAEKSPRKPLPKPDIDEDDEEERTKGHLVRKGRHVSLRTTCQRIERRSQRWYADPEIASLLRHDLEPLTPIQSKGYFDTFILPSSARGLCFAIHERTTGRLIGTTALTDREKRKDGESALFRIVIGEKDCWNKGYGTEATRLVMQEAFETLGLGEVRLEVFTTMTVAVAAYTKVGFKTTGEHVEWVSQAQDRAAGDRNASDGRLAESIRGR